MAVSLCSKLLLSVLADIEGEAALSRKPQGVPDGQLLGVPVGGIFLRADIGLIKLRHLGTEATHVRGPVLVAVAFKGAIAAVADLVKRLVKEQSQPETGKYLKLFPVGFKCGGDGQAPAAVDAVFRLNSCEGLEDAFAV